MIWFAYVVIGTVMIVNILRCLRHVENRIRQIGASGDDSDLFEMRNRLDHVLWVNIVLFVGLLVVSVISGIELNKVFG